LNRVRGETAVRLKARLAGGHTIDGAVQILWRIIDEARMYMEDPRLTPEEKRRWAKTLADTIGVLNKLLASQGEKQLEDQDLGSLLTRVPETLKRTVMLRARVWIRKSS